MLLVERSQVSHTHTHTKDGNISNKPSGWVEVIFFLPEPASCSIQPLHPRNAWKEKEERENRRSAQILPHKHISLCKDMPTQQPGISLFSHLLSFLYCQLSNKAMKMPPKIIILRKQPCLPPSIYFHSCTVPWRRWLIFRKMLYIQHVSNTHDILSFLCVCNVGR